MAKATLKKKLQFWGTGRRKKAIARVRLIPAGSGNIVINERSFEDYFPQSVLRYDVMQPLVLLAAEGKYDVYVNVYGGGLTGQAGAIRLGISRRSPSSRARKPSRPQKGRLLNARPPRQRAQEVRS